MLRKFKMNDILHKINILSKNKDKTLYHFISEQLTHESNDINLWISLAIAIVAPPFGDEGKAIAFIQKALDIDNNNPLALLILTHVYEYELGGIDDILLYQIKNLVTDSNEINSMLKYVASWSYGESKKEDPEMQEKLLKESIELWDKHVWNYEHLARLYLKQKRYLEVNSLITKALSNVQKIYTDKNINDYRSANIEDFINSRIKGTHITDSNVESIQEKLVPKHIVLWYRIITPFLGFYHFIKTAILRSMNFEE